MRAREVDRASLRTFLREAYKLGLNPLHALRNRWGVEAHGGPKGVTLTFPSGEVINIKL